MRRPTHALALLAILAAGAGVLAVRDSAAQTPPAFTETFDGSPLSPAPFAPSDWWVQYHHRSPGAWAAPEMMEAQHDPLCNAPPATHHIMAWPDSVFHCRDHVMTAISASSYGVLYLTPPAMVDFSQGEAVVRFDVSTARIGPRDWWDVWVTPKPDAMALPLETDWPDLQGVPKNAVTVRLNESQYRFNGLVSRNYAVTGLPTNTGLLYNNLFTPSATLRQTVELRISRTHIQFGMPYPTLDNGSIGPPRWWINATVADLGWDQGVIHLGHHSYSPCKGTTIPAPCPSTYHWDNLTIFSAVPLPLARFPDHLIQDEADRALPATAGAVWFSAVTNQVMFCSFDGGFTWQGATLVRGSRQQTTYGPVEHAASWRCAIPPGATAVRFRGANVAGWSVWTVFDPAVVP